MGGMSMDENSLPISASTIGYIITGIILFFLVISAIVGYKRGFKNLFLGLFGWQSLLSFLFL